MRASLVIFYLVYLLNSLVILGAHGVNIQLYKHANFTGLVLESSMNGGCNNVPRDKRALVYFIRTDTCFIAYYHENCQSYLTEKYLPGDIILSSDQLGRNRLIISFHTCNEDEGGNQLNVDITQYKNSSKPSKVLKSYRKSFGPNPNSAYFLTSCNSSHVVATETTKTIESTTEVVTDQTAGVNCQGYQVLANLFAELKTQVDRFERNQEKFQRDILKTISQIDCSY